MTRKSRISNGLVYSLAIISIIGFSAIVGSAFFNFDFLENNTGAFILLVLGAGLVAESQVRKWKNFKQNGLSSTEIAHVVTGVIGLLALIAGVISIIGINNATLESLKGIVSSIAIVMIVLQTWVVD